jgi:putative ubiquitin-RnfH superfamily antitoxin RatB of RatAB toxin-antitoxin module
LARDALRLKGLPHGISAIRKQLGRGSPGLISQHLRELDAAPVELRSALPSIAINAIAAQLIEAFRGQFTPQNAPAMGVAEVDVQVGSKSDSGVRERQLQNANRIVAEQSAHIDQLRGDVMSLERRLATTEAENAGNLSNVAALREELQVQRNTFELWRRDHVRDRAMLSARIEILGNALGPPKAGKSRLANRQDAGKQLELYGQSLED